jgi:hypothetical protein
LFKIVKKTVLEEFLISQRNKTVLLINIIYTNTKNVSVWDSGFGGLEVACWPLVPKFAGSNSAEAVGFFRKKKSSARLPSEGK